ncbi:Protein HID1 HID1 domain-containing protein [Collichthys lucidus]|uniref:Protein HID1 HID1 domain-containing protein n=1 Tax=Collichthys lucidus TaxID=240159 RepID=A0A4U5VLX7_COLLU|nr:Protein HID1 HID1 domain-containing protein [Collichthys lucidus]
MGNADTKLHFRKAVIQLTTKTQPVEASDDAFWDQFWADSSTTVQDVFALVPAAEIRAVREESPSNLATLCYKAVERLVQGAESGCPSEKERQIVLNCTRLLTRILPYIFEDADWRGFFWSTVPGAGRAGRLDEDDDEDDARPLAESLLLAVADLLFCPDFTAQSHKKNGLDAPEDIRSIDSCEYIWEAGVGFAQHALPLFTSLLNVVCAYDPVGYGIPYNHLLFSDHREQLVEQAVQILIVTLEHDAGSAAGAALQALDRSASPSALEEHEAAGPDNLFVNYLSRIHREEDLGFILKGLARLLNNPLVQTYLPRSTKKIQFHQELLILFWKFSRVGLMHIAVFILLLLSGERNFGVRLNKPYTLRVPMDVPVFTGTHADLLIVIFHKVITSGHQRLQPLFDCLLTIIVNISPYLKSLSMVSANKLLHLLEAFSTPWFLFSYAQNHHLVFFLLEAFNNIIQYQFDGNSNLVYAIIRKRSIFHQLANLASDTASIQKALQKKKKSGISRTNSIEMESMEGSRPAVPAEPGTLKASLEATPGIDKITEKAQVGEDGTMIVLPHSDSPKTTAVARASDAESSERDHEVHHAESESVRSRLSSVSSSAAWSANPDWVLTWKAKLPLQTIMRLLQVLVPQVEKICIDKGLTDESEILKFLQHGTLVGLLPVPHPILIRKYQANAGTAMWFRTYMWGIIYLRNVDPPIWYDTDIRLFEIQRI